MRVRTTDQPWYGQQDPNDLVVVHLDYYPPQASDPSYRSFFALRVAASSYRYPVYVDSIVPGERSTNYVCGLAQYYAGVGLVLSMIPNGIDRINDYDFWEVNVPYSMILDIT